MAIRRATGSSTSFCVSINPSLWFPYRRYRKLHLIHHNDEHLTDPQLDPESYYLLPDHWARAAVAAAAALHAQQHARRPHDHGPGHRRDPLLVVGSAWPCIKGDREVIRAWLLHIPACAVTLVYALWVCGIPFWQYVAALRLSGHRALARALLLRAPGGRRHAASAPSSSKPRPSGRCSSSTTISMSRITRGPRLPWYELPGLLPR